MAKAGLTADLIIAKIKTSLRQFDTSPSALVSLKEAGVPDAVCLRWSAILMARHPSLKRSQSVDRNRPNR